MNPDGGLVTVELGDRGHAWIRRALQDGGALSRVAVKQLPLASGNVTTVLPRDVMSEAFDFDDGIQLSPATWHRASETLIERARKSSGQAFIIENPMAKPPPPGESPTNILVIGDNVYYWIDGQTSTPDLDRLIQHHGAMYSTVAYVLRLKTTVDPQSWRESEIANILSLTSHLVVGAYDATGYVMWERA